LGLIFCCHSDFEAGLGDLVVRVELHRHRLLLRGQLEVARDRASAEPDTCVFGKAANKEVVLLLTVGGVLDVKLVKGHL